MLGPNLKACNMLRKVHHTVDIVRGGGAYFPVWAIRELAARQCTVFWARCPKQGIQFDLPLSQTG